MSTYKQIFGKAIKSFTGDPNPSPITYTVTVANPGAGNRYYIDGVLTPTLELYEGNTYIFNYPSGHPFKFSTTSNGTHSGGSEYTAGVTHNSSTQVTIVVQTGAPTLYYYCSLHSNMGATALTPAADASYEGQIWYNETLGKFRSVVMSGAFSSGGSLNVGRYAIGSAGTFTAGLAIGGDLFPSPPGRGSNSTEEYNGTSWATGGNLGTSASWRAGAGTQTAASGTAGNNYSSYISTSENYDGSSWTSATSAPYAAEGSVSTGSRPASIWGGGGSPPGAYPNTFFYGDGEGWTAITGSNNSARYAAVFTGTQTAALLTGGHTPQSSNTESWDGSSWSNETAFPRVFANGGGNRVGTNTSGVVVGGTSTALPSQNLSSTHWDGTAWAADASLSVLKTSSTSAGTQNQYYVAGAPNPGSAPGRANTEEYEKTIYSPVAATWSSGGNLNTARHNGAVSGGKTAGLYAGGKVYPNSFQNASEEYDGTSWAEGNNLGTARSGVGGAGTQTAGLAAGGTNGAPGSTGVQTATEEYGGTSWTAGGALSTARMNTSTAGLQTAAFLAGGIGSPNSLVDTVEHYNGSSWTSGTAMPVVRSNSAAAGTQTAGLAFGGYVPPSYAYANTAVEYDGEGWTAGGSLSVARESLGGFGSQTNAVAFGGTSPPNTNSTSTELYNGTSWSTAPNLATGRTGFSPSGSYNSGTDGFAAGGSQQGNPMNAQTEEWSSEVIALDYKSISSS